MRVFEEQKMRCSSLLEIKHASHSNLETQSTTDSVYTVRSAGATNQITVLGG